MVYRCIFDEHSSIDNISFVESPAIIEPLMYSKDYLTDKTIKLIYENNIITSPLLIPNQYIYRRDAEGEYYIYYTDADVITAANHIINNSKKIRFNYEHTNTFFDNINIIGVGLVGDFVNLNYYSLPQNTLFIQLLVNNDEVIKMIKEGKIQGLSIEGVMSMIEDTEAFIDLEIKRNNTLKYNTIVNNKTFVYGK